MTTGQHRTNIGFGLLLLAGLLVVIPLSFYFGRKGRVVQHESAVAAGGSAALSDSSFGAVKIGMTLRELEGAIGPLGDTTRLNRACDIVSAADPFRLPPGVSITQVKGRVARIDIENDSIATDKGVRVGDTEEKVKQLYGSGVLVEPHKFISGHYLEIRSGSDSATAKGIVFETDGRKITTFRAGFWEPVRWVEGCG